MGQIHSPESVAVYNGSVFTVSFDGYIYKIENNQIIKVVKILQFKDPLRPSLLLGVRFDSKGNLYAIEGGYGVYKVENIFTAIPKVTQVFDLRLTSSLGKASKFIDDLEIDETDGNVVLYLTDVSVNFDPFYAILCATSSEKGRLIKYDINEDKLETVIDGLYFPNGLQLTDDKTAILISESSARRIIKYYIRGEMKGKTETFIDNLPGEPDNIRRSAAKDETYWFTIARNVANLGIMQFIEKPFLRAFAARLLYLGQYIESFGRHFNLIFIEELGLNIRSGFILMQFKLHEIFIKYANIIEISKTGQILQTLQSNDGHINLITEAREVKTSDDESELYLGNVVDSYLGRIKLANRKLN